MLDTALNNNSDKLKELIETMKRHNVSVENELKHFYDKDELNIDKFGNYKNGRFGSLSMIGKIQKTTYDRIKDQNIKKELKEYIGE